MIYLDHAATTPLDPRVLEAMLPHLEQNWGNPSSPHAKGREAKQALENARQTVADLLGYKPHEVVFTASGSEANALAIRGRTDWWQSTHGTPGTVVSSAVEHKCTLESVKQLNHWDIQLLPCDTQGQIDPSNLPKQLTEETALVSVQWANNEVGTLQPIAEIASVCQEKHVPFHCDAIQAIAHLPLPSPQPDLLSIAAHKFSGPKGIGALIVRDTVDLEAQIRGGDQEMQLRAGTENVPGAVGLATALQLAIAEQEQETKRLQKLRDRFTQGALAFSGISLNGHATDRLPGLTCLRFDGQNGETIVIQLDQAGICVSTGSACTIGASEPSHVLEAMGQSPKQARQAVRFSFGKHTTESDIAATLQTLRDILSSN